jgi:hypothetical protein
MISSFFTLLRIAKLFIQELFADYWLNYRPIGLSFQVHACFRKISALSVSKDSIDTIKKQIEMHMSTGNTRYRKKIQHRGLLFELLPIRNRVAIQHFKKNCTFHSSVRKSYFHCLLGAGVYRKGDR